MILIPRRENRCRNVKREHEIQKLWWSRNEAYVILKRKTLKRVQIAVILKLCHTQTTKFYNFLSVVSTTNLKRRCSRKFVSVCEHCTWTGKHVMLQTFADVPIKSQPFKGKHFRNRTVNASGQCSKLFTHIQTSTLAKCVFLYLQMFVNSGGTSVI